MSLGNWIDASRPLLLVGCGNMGGAMARGWLAGGLDEDAFAGIDLGVAAAHQKQWA